jgi:protein-tyrosine phosphatase
VTLYADAQPAPWGVEELRFGFPDADLTPEFAERAIALARHAHRRWRDGERVLVRCQAGVNRSGLVMALVLMLDGMDAHDAIALIRERRAPRPCSATSPTCAGS